MNGLKSARSPKLPLLDCWGDCCSDDEPHDVFSSNQSDEQRPHVLVKNVEVPITGEGPDVRVSHLEQSSGEPLVFHH